MSVEVNGNARENQQMEKRQHLFILDDKSDVADESCSASGDLERINLESESETNLPKPLVNGLLDSAQMVGHGCFGLNFEPKVPQFFVENRICRKPPSVGKTD